MLRGTRTFQILPVIICDKTLAPGILNLSLREQWAPYEAQEKAKHETQHDLVIQRVFASHPVANDSALGFAVELLGTWTVLVHFGTPNCAWTFELHFFSC